MDYEGGDPFASQYSEYGSGYGVPPGYAPQPYSFPQYAPPMPPSYYSAPQYAPPMYGGAPSPANAYYNPYGPTLPMTDLAPDAWGGYATPTAFSKYIDQYEKGIRHSAFDDAPLLGSDLVWVTLRSTGEKIQVPKDQVKALRDADFIVGARARVAQDYTEGAEHEWGRQ
jgi:hypothetical protein